MRAFDFYSPVTVVEALELLNQHKDSVAIVAGGTDIVLELNERHIRPAVVVDFKRLKELEYITIEDGVVRIGAMTTHAAIAADERIKKHVKVLWDACRQVGSPQIRNLGTIGGNISTSSVAGDGLAACVALDADVTVKSVRGERTMKLDEFLAGEGFSKRNIMEADEMLTEVSFKLPDERTATGFYKLAKRKSLAISVIGAGMVVSVDENGVCTYARLRAGALGRYPMLFEAFEQHLVGKKLTMETVKAGLPLMGEHVMTVNKGRASAIYKKDAVQGAYEHLFEDAIAELGL